MDLIGKKQEEDLSTEKELSSIKDQLKKWQAAKEPVPKVKSIDLSQKTDPCAITTSSADNSHKAECLKTGRGHTNDLQNPAVNSNDRGHHDQAAALLQTSTDSMKQQDDAYTTIDTELSTYGMDQQMRGMEKLMMGKF